MPSGIELIFGVTHPRIDPVLAALHITPRVAMESGFPIDLRPTQTAILRDLGFADFKPTTDWGQHFMAKHAALKIRREFSAMDFELAVEREFDEEFSDDSVVLGVAVSGRYFPVCLDWRDTHGSLSPIIFDAEFLHERDLAEKHLRAAGLPPVFYDHAVWIVKERWY